MSDCGFCNGIGQADESTISGWTKVACPVCAKPRTDDDKATLAADFRADVERIKAAIGTPAWMMR